MILNIDQLQYMIEVAKYGSLSVAAKNLHVTQSTISQSISNLEKELGIKIFNRSRGHGAITTHEGEIILKLAYEAQKKLSEIKETADKFNSTEVGNLIVSSTPGLVTFLLKAITDFKTEFPHVHVEINEKRGNEIIDDVRLQKTDIALIPILNNLHMNLEGIIFKPLFHGKIKIYVSKHSPLAAFESVSPNDILDQTLVSYNGEYLMNFIQDFFKQHKPMKVLFTSNNVEALLQAITDDLAITFAPDFVMNNFSAIQNGDIVPIELINHDKLGVSLGLMYPKDKILSAFANKYIDFLHFETLKSLENKQ